MDPISVVVVSGVIASVVAIKSSWAYLDVRAARRGLTAATRLTSSTPEGEFTCVTGVVRSADSTIKAPLSARTCVVARARFRMMQAGVLGIGARPYETFAIVPFFVEAPVGRVRVEGRYASLDVPSRAMSKRRSAPGSREHMLAEHGVSDGPRSIWLFDESIVEPGTLVSVAGVLMKEAAGQPDGEERGYRQPGPPALVLQGTLAQPLVIGRPVH